MIELKSSEKLTSIGRAAIESYLLTLVRLLPSAGYALQVQLVHTLRCAVLFVDPSKLKTETAALALAQSQQILAHGPQGQQAVMDRQYIIDRLTASGALAYLAQAYAGLAMALDYSLSQADEQQTSAQSQQQQEEEEDLTLYGLPPKQPAQQRAGPGAEGAAVVSAATPTAISAVVAPVKPSLSQMRDLSHSYLDLFLDMSCHSECMGMLAEQGLAGSLFMVLQKELSHAASSTAIPCLLDVLWFVLDCFLHGTNPLKMHLLGNGLLDCETAVTTLNHLLTHYLHNGYKAFDKECRNEVIILLMMLIDCPNAIGYFISTGCWDGLLTYACVEEVLSGSLAPPGTSLGSSLLGSFGQTGMLGSTGSGSGSGSAQGGWAYFIKPLASSRNFSQHADIDYEFKSSLWCLISKLLASNDYDALVSFAASPLMPVLLAYMEGIGGQTQTQTLNSQTQTQTQKFKPKPLGTTISTSHPAALHGNKKSYIETLSLRKLKEFQTHAVLLLLSHATKVMGEFERIHGPSRVLQIALQKCSTDECYVTSQCLLLVYRCVASSVTCRACMEESRAIQYLLYIFQSSTDEDTQAIAVRTIGLLCENAVGQEQFLAAHCIEAFLSPLRDYMLKRPVTIGAGWMTGLTSTASATSSSTSTSTSIVVIALLAALHAGIVGNTSNILQFTSVEGTDVLLDLLEIAPTVLRYPVLRLLADLLTTHLLIPYLSMWRSQHTLRSVEQLLCHAWIDEEIRLKSQRDSSQGPEGAIAGVIADLFHPLSSQVWPSGNLGNRVLLLRGISQQLTSKTVLKLSEAIESANALQSNLPVSILKELLVKDMRVLLASILRGMGLLEQYLISDSSNPFKDIPNTQDSPAVADASPDSPAHTNNFPRSNTTLTPSERQVLSLAGKYATLFLGECWAQVMRATEEVLPIEADQSLMRGALEQAFDASMALQTEQMQLHTTEEVVALTTEEALLGQILTKKQQQIKAEWLKRKKAGGGVLLGTKKVTKAAGSTM